MGLLTCTIALLLLLFIGETARVAENSQLEAFLTQTEGNLPAGYFQSTSGCIDDFIRYREGRGSPPRQCRKAANGFFKANGRNVTSSTDSSVNPVCQYRYKSHTVYVPSTGNKRDVASVWVTVQQHSCSEQSKAGAGSSMRLSAGVEGGDCRLKRAVGEDYTFTCHFNVSASPQIPSLSTYKQKATGVSCNALCNVTFSASLDYEGFGAFDEVTSQQHGMNRVVLKKTVGVLPLSNDKDGGGERAYTHKPSCCPLQKYDATSAAVTARVQSKAAAGAAALDLNNLDQVRARFRQYAAVYFIGTSHMRYLWDAVAVQYFNGSAILEKLPQHHRDEAAANTWFINNFFTMELPGVIQEVCAKDSVYAPTSTEASDKPIVFIIQAGSWDLDYNPVRNLVSYPNSSAAVVELIRKLTTAGNTCHGHATQVMWVTSPPMPECDASPGAPVLPSATSSKGVRHTEKSSCFDKGYRNNYAIAAANQYFVQAITGASTASTTGNKTPPAEQSGSSFSQWWAFLGLGSKRKDASKTPHRAVGSSGGVIMHDPGNPLLTVLDAYSIVYPDRQQHVCGLHYLCCKHAPRVNTVDMLYTPGGSALLETLLTVLLA